MIFVFEITFNILYYQYFDPINIIFTIKYIFVEVCYSEAERKEKGERLNLFVEVTSP